jgi:hypothetical protein
LFIGKRSYLGFLLYLILSVAATLPIQAQQPAYFLLGEDQFRGLQVYDAIQDSLQNYLFSTNEGIYYFDYYRFEKIGCPDSKSSAFFNFVADSRGTVYCCNINHQVFKIQNRQCSLLYELKPDEVGIDLSLAIGPQQELLAAARKVIALDSEGNVLDVRTHRSNYFGFPFSSKLGEVWYHIPHTDSLLVFGAAGFQLRQLKFESQSMIPVGSLALFRIDSMVYGCDRESKALFLLDESTMVLHPKASNPAFERSKSIRFYPVGDETWIAGTLPGASRLHNAIGATAIDLFFEDYFISDIFQDHEGNLLLSTFDQGILVVPDLSIPDVIHRFRDDPVTALYAEQAQKDLYLGSSKGQLLHYHEGKFTTLSTKGMRAIESIHSSPDFPYLIYDDGVIHFLDKRSGKTSQILEAVLKDAVIFPPATAYLGTNVGLYECTWAANGKATFAKLPGMDFRIHLLEQDGPAKSIVASTSIGMFRIDSLGNRKKIMDAGQDIFPTAMVAAAGTVYAATSAQGILLIRGNEVVDRIRPEGANLQILRKLLLLDHTLLAKSSHAIYQFGMQGQLIRNISKVYGFPETRVYDFALMDSLIWVSHARGVQAVNLRQSQSQAAPPILQLSEVLVNGKATLPTAAGRFPSDPTKLQFYLASPTLRHKENLRLHYRLLGYDTVWTIKANDGNPIVYNALASGDYTLEAKAENDGQWSPVVRYAFTIATPFYAQWWFILLSFASLVVILALVFVWRLNVQRKKAQQINELNASKLTAIQSQMNPHFIFNALNSIQDLVLKGDVENSYSYITTFSNLVRSTLDYSEKEFIDFEQEVKLLQLYLTLEQLRFKKSLDFSIDQAGIDDIQLPPLLIQPFVENALVHGLLHKEGPKILKIRFVLDDVLTCVIEDNGIGRQKAKAIRERQRVDHESFSGKAIRKRFDILSEILTGQFGYEYEDLIQDGQPVGTRVTLRIPVKRRF